MFHFRSVNPNQGWYFTESELNTAEVCSVASFASEPGLMTQGVERAGRHGCSSRSGLRFCASPKNPRRSLLSAGPLNLAQPRNAADQTKCACWWATWTQTCATNSNVLRHRRRQQQRPLEVTQEGRIKRHTQKPQRTTGTSSKTEGLKTLTSTWLFWKWSELCHFSCLYFWTQVVIVLDTHIPFTKKRTGSLESGLNSTCVF